jgi:hypothetical protein
MDTRKIHAIRRVAMALLMTAGLGGCAVYGPPYAGYDPYYPGSAYPAYVGPPIDLSLGFGFYDGHRHGNYGGHHGWGSRGGWGHHGGGWRHGRGRR